MPTGFPYFAKSTNLNTTLIVSQPGGSKCKVSQVPNQYQITCM